DLADAADDAVECDRRGTRGERGRLLHLLAERRDGSRREFPADAQRLGRPPPRGGGPIPEPGQPAMRLNWIRSRAARLAHDEGGFTMIAVVSSIALVSALVGASIVATNSDQGLLRRDIAQKQAYQAAQAGIADYTYHLNNDSGYWTRCTAVPTPNAVNQQG